MEIRSKRTRVGTLVLAPALLLFVTIPLVAAGDSRSDPNTARAAASDRVVPPELLPKSQRAPIYPAAARAARISGWVVVETTIDEAGKVKAARPIECTHLKVGLEEAAVEAVMRWRFRPALYRGEPVEYKTRYRLHFGRRSAGLSGAHLALTLAPAHSVPTAARAATSPRPQTSGSGGNSKGTVPRRD